MTDGKLKRLLKFEAEAAAELKRHKEAMITIRGQIASIRHSCDHTYPNGVSALKSERWKLWCQICGFWQRDTNVPTHKRSDEDVGSGRQDS